MKTRRLTGFIKVWVQFRRCIYRWATSTDMFKSFVTSSFSTVSKKTNSGRVCQTGQHYEIHYHWCSHTWLDRLAHAAWASWGFRQQRALAIIESGHRQTRKPLRAFFKGALAATCPQRVGAGLGTGCKGTPKRKKQLNEGTRSHTHNTEKDRARNFWFWGTVRKLNSHLWAATNSQFQTGVGCNSLGSRRQAHSFHWSINASLVSLTTESTEMRK
jgi:hypothetical protein